MNTQTLTRQVQQLSLDDQLQLLESLWDNLSRRSSTPGPTPAQSAELTRRLDAYLANPDQAIPGNEAMRKARHALRPGGADFSDHHAAEN